MANKLEELKAKIEDEERKKQLGQQAVPFTYQTVGKEGLNFTLDKILQDKIPYTVDLSDYATYTNLVDKYTKSLNQETENVRPSNAKELYNRIISEGRQIGRTGTGNMMFAGGNQLSKEPIKQANAQKTEAENSALEALYNALRYQTDTDYMLGEKTNNYQDFTTRIKEALSDKEALKRIMEWGGGMVQPGTRQKAQAAAEEATDGQLTQLLNGARTPSEKQVFQNEIDRRKTTKTVTPLYELLNEKDKADMDAAIKGGYAPGDDIVRQQLQNETDELTMLLAYGNFSDQERADMQARQQTILNGLKAYDDNAAAAQKTAEESQAVKDYLAWQAAGEDTLFANRYVQELQNTQAENAQIIQDWDSVLRNNYQGADKTMQDAGGRYSELWNELQKAQLEALTGATEQEKAEARQRADEISAQLDALEAQAESETKTARDTIASAQQEQDTIKEAQYGEKSWLRLIGADAKQALTNINKGIVDFAGLFIKPVEAIGRIGYNVFSGNKETAGQALVQTANGNGIWSSLEKSYDEQAHEAATEAYNARMAISDSVLLEVANEVLVNTFEQLPDILMNLATYGGKAGVDMAVRAQDAAMKLINSQDMGQLQKLVTNMTGNTSFWTAYIREWGSDKDELEEAGTPAWLSSTLATLTALQNAMIEIGGVQEIGVPDADDGALAAAYTKLTGKTPGKIAEVALGLGETAFEEGSEEFWQGLGLGSAEAIGRAAAGEYTPFISLTPGETAVLNVPDTAKEAAVGGLAGLAMAGTIEPAIDFARNRSATRAAQKEQEQAKQKAAAELTEEIKDTVGTEDAQAVAEALVQQETGGTLTDEQKAVLEKHKDEMLEAGRKAAKQKSIEALTEQIKDAVGEEDAQDVAEALIDQATGAELTEEQTAVLEKHKDVLPTLHKDIQEEALDGEAMPAFGANEAYQMGLSGRREEELRDTLNDMGLSMTGDIQRAYDRGRADLAAAETDRINKVKEWNAGQDGSRVGVLRSIQPEEAEKAGVNTVSAEYTERTRQAITALRGLAQATGINMVLFESPTKEGTHVGANGWYDRDTRTVYLDVYSGKDNEQALMRTASHELTHFIQDWSPANYRKYRDFLIDYYYGGSKNGLKKLIQEQLDKDGTLTEAQAMDEVIADASEMMLGGEENPEKAVSAAKALSEEHPKLFTRVKNWIDTWAKALVKAWRGTEPSNAASRLLRASAEKFQEAQKIWYEALEDASVNHRGEVRSAEIEAEREEKLTALRARLNEYTQAAEKRRLEAIARADAARTAEAGRQAVQEAQAADAAKKAIEAQEKEEAAKINREAEKKKKEAEKVTKQGQRNEKLMGRMTDGARGYVTQFAEENGFALDGTAKAGDDLLKEAMHYFNQGKAGIDFNPNTPGGKGPFVDFFRKMNQYGQEEKNRAALEEMAAEGDNVPTAEQNAQEEEERRTAPERPALHKDEQEVALDGEAVPEAEEERRQAPERPILHTEEQEVALDGEAVPETEKERRQAPERPALHKDEQEVALDGEAVPETEKTLEEIAGEAEAQENDLADRMKAIVDKVRRGEIDDIEGIAEARAEANKEFRNRGGEATDEGGTETIEHDFFMRENFNPIRKEIISANREYERQKVTDNAPTMQETQAMETHAQTVQKMADVLKGMTKKAQNLVMKWAGNEYINTKMEEGNIRALRFAQFAKAWYDAGREGTPVSQVQFDETWAEEDFPPFLEDEFYKAGKVDAEALLKKKQKAKEAKQNEKPADQGTGERVGTVGNGAGGILEGEPAKNVQEYGGEGNAVSAAESQERPNAGANGGPDESGLAGVRGEGVYQRDDVRPGAGGITEEAETETEPQTPEEEQARETEEKTAETVEKTETYLDSETPRGTNYVIGDSLGLAKNTSEKTRYQDNVKAIRLLQKLEAENRYATTEEQEILSKYVGWGGLPNVFPNGFGEVDPKWKREYAELAELLTQDEYQAANASVQNAHYTSIEVIRAMYEGLRHLGFQGGRMLEPSGGIGHFIGAMPADMQQQVRSWTMVELDSITGRIAKKLYPLADVRIQGFQDTNIANNLMDVAIGNVPFGSVKIYDKAYPENLRTRIHNYFFAKAIDKVRPGGVLMFITSHGTMDAMDNPVRSYMMERADLLGAVRLPWTAFKSNANTEVVTDILIFKKRNPDTAYNGEAFRYVNPVLLGGERYYVNEYFQRHPEMVLGEQTNTGTMRGAHDYNVEPKGKNLGEQITAAINTIKGRMDYSAEMPTVEEVQQRAAEADRKTKDNGFEVKGGKVYQNKEGQLAEVKKTKTRKDGTVEEEALTEEDVQRITDMLSMRDTARELQDMQKRGADLKEIKKQREKLNKEYDGFQKKYEYKIQSGKNKGKVIPGMLHDPKNAKLIEADPDNFFILSLENYDKKAGTAKKADIFEKDTIAPVQTVTHADTPLEAMTVTLNEKGYIDLAHVAALLGESQEQAQKELLESGAAFLTEKNTLESRANYLSGDVRAKLREAEKLATVDKRFERNVEELKKVIPKDVPYEDINVKPGMTWIPTEVYEQFICETIKQYNYRDTKNVSVTFNPFNGEYILDFSPYAKGAYLNREEWGAGGKSFQWILDKLMNSRSMKVTYTDEEKKTHTDEDATAAVEAKAEKIQEQFTKWLWQDGKRAEQLAKLYNDQYNAIVDPEYDGNGLTVPGLNARFTFRPHQASVIQRGVQQGGNLLIAHCVGAGKTLEMASIAMKLKQLGIIKKPVFAAPKHLVGQWGKEFLKFYPAAKILVLDQNSFTPKNKKEFLNRIATGDYDAVIMSYEQFKGVPMTPEYVREYKQNLLNEAVAAREEAKRAAGKKGSSVKQLQNFIDNLKVQLEAMTDLKRDEASIYFEDMGIDGIFLDEAQNHKNLFFTTQMDNVSGVGDGTGSDRANDMYMKVRWLRQVNGGRGIVFATGTPVMNTMGEMYLMQKYLQEDKLEQIGIRSFDAWAKMFGKVVNTQEKDATGERKKKQVFAEFNNLPELQRLFRAFTDVKTTLDDVKNVKVPKMKTGKRILVIGEQSERQKQYQQELKELAQTIKGRKRQKGEESFLTITTKGRKAAYTQRMIDPSLPYEEGSKIVKAAENIAQIWQESSDIKGTQIVFCDMGVPSSKAGKKVKGPEAMGDTEITAPINFYQDIKNILIGKGVPANEIAFIHDYKTDEAKVALFEDVNEGKVRVLIGSTGMMGTGMNAQERVVALHHLDAPWRPGDLTQREGRALRQGNINDEVGIYVYVTQGSFDEVMWGKLARKARIVNNVMNGTNELRTIEGEGDDALSFQEIMAASSDDPLVQEQFDVQDKIRKLEGLEREHRRDQRRAKETAELDRAYIENAKIILPKAEADAKTAQTALDAPFVMKVDGKRYDERAKAAEPLRQIVWDLYRNQKAKKVGEYGGFVISMNDKGKMEIRGATVHEVDPNFENANGNMSRFMNEISNITGIPERMRAEIERRTQEMESAEKRMQEPFEKEAELKKLYNREAEIEKQLNPPDQRVPVAEEEEKPEKKIKYSKRETDEQTVNMTTDRIDAAIKEYGAKFSTNYSKAYMTYISPEDFLSLTTSDTGKIVNESRKLNVAELQDERQTPFIDFDQQTGAVTGHEGRHRMAALKNAGVEKVAILVKPNGSEGRYDRKTLNNLTVTGQDFGFAKATGTVTLSNLIPVNESHRQELIDTYGESENKFQYSTRDPDDLSNRQLLARAYEGIIKDEGDRKYLERYKALIATLDADTEEIKRLKKEYHDKTFVKGQVDKAGAEEAQKKYRALEKKVAEADKTLLRLERSEPLKKVLEFEQKEAKRKAEERANSTIKNYYEGVNRREYAVRIKKTAERLGQWINHPDNKKHVPKAAQQAVADFLLSITQSRTAEFKGQGGARRERNFIESMRRLKDYVDDVDAYKTSSAEERVEEDYGEFIDLPAGFKEQLAALITSLEKTIGVAGKNFVVDDMTSEQMKELYKVMMTVSTTISTINDFLTESAFKHVDQAAQNSMRFIQDQGKVEYWGSGKLHNYMNWENTQPIRALERFGEGGMAIWNGLKRGQAQLAFNLEEAIRLAEGRFTNDEINAWGLKGLKGDMFTPEEVKKWNEIVKEFSMNGRKVPMTAAQAMSVYLLLKRGQAVGHIFGEGIRVAPFQNGKKMVRDEGGPISQEEAAAIAAYVESDPRMKQIADNMQRIIANYGKKMGNPVNMKRFGYEFMTEDNYWPIETDPLHRQAKTDSSKGNELYRLLNISSVKPLTEGARNRIVIRGAFDVFAQNLIDMAQYNALALPVLDAVKWINYREKWQEKTEDGRIKTVYGKGIRDEAFTTYGGQAARYIIELLKDIQGTQATGDWGEDFSRKMLQRYNRAAIAANLSVAAKQPMSITRAAMELGSLDLITGALKNVGQYKHNLDTMLKYSGIAVWKINMGFYDVNVSRSAKRLILRDDTKMDKLLNATTALNEKMDTITWAAIWGASENWVRKQGGTYASTDAFYKAVADKFDDVIYKTQVVDSILTRSQFMRGTSFQNKWFSSFMSEPTTSYNMVLDAWWKFRNDMRRGLNFGQAFMENKNQILRTTAVYMVSAAVMTILEAVIGAWRDDDDYETFLEKFQSGILNNALDEFNLLNNLPIVKDVMEFVKQALADYVLPDEWNVYANAGGSSPVFSGFETLKGAADVWDKILTGNSNYTLYGAIYKTANGLSQISGIPVAPAMREAVALWNNAIGYAVPEMRIETYDSTVKQGAAALYKAIKNGDENREKTVRGQLAANNVEDDKLESALKSMIKADMEAGNISQTQAEKYLQEYGGLGKNDAYFKVQEWEYEADSDGQYHKYDQLKEAISKGTGIDSAIRDLTAHGVSQKDVQTQVRSAIVEQTAKEKKMTVSQAVDLLQKYGGMTKNEAWIRGQELTYQQKTGTATTADIAMVIYAIDQNTSPKEAIDGLLAHGKDKKSIASSLTSKYKQTYLDMRQSNPSKAAALKGRLISIYEYLGYDGKKKVEEWENPKKK